MSARGSTILLAAVLAAWPGVTCRADASLSVSIRLEITGSLARARQFLLRRQHTDGSWDGDLPATAQAYVALANGHSAADAEMVDRACRLAIAYLRRALADAGSLPEGRRPRDVAAALTALARDGSQAHADVIHPVRARLLQQAATGADPAGIDGWDALEAVAVLDGLYATELLAPGQAATLYPRLLHRFRGWTGPAVSGSAAPAAPADTLSAAAALRALLYARVPVDDAGVTAAAEQLTALPPRSAAAVWLTAEARQLLTMVEATAVLRLIPSRDALAGALLEAQQGDGGWPADAGEPSRAWCTASAIRALQIIRGPGTDTATGP